MHVLNCSTATTMTRARTREFSSDSTCRATHHGRDSAIVSSNVFDQKISYIAVTLAWESTHSLLMPFSFRPESASLRLPEVVAFNAKHNPDAPFYVFPKPGPSEGVGTITYLEFARASQRAAHLLRPSREGPDGEVVAVIALSDSVLYQAVVVGLMTANLVVRRVVNLTLTDL